MSAPATSRYFISVNLNLGRGSEPVGKYELGIADPDDARTAAAAIDEVIRHIIQNLEARCLEKKKTK
jgi:hypothetical protein